MQYRKKPVVIEAFRVGIENIPDWFMDKVTSNDIILRRIPFDEARATNYGLTYCEIKTLEGVMRGDYGDFIIKGVNGEIYPCKPDIFDKTYEPVNSKTFMCVNIEITDMPEFKEIINSLGKILADERIPEEIRVEHYEKCNEALEKLNIKN